jgi:hypothetical protein
MRKWFSGTLIGLLFLTGLVVPIFAATNATLTGRISDPQGAVIVGATVKATNVETNVTASAETNQSGLYTIPDLIPGRYRVTVEKTAFETIVRNPGTGEPFTGFQGETEGQGLVIGGLGADRI